MTLRQGLVIAALGLLGWALCGAIMFVGMSVASLRATLVAHLIGSPVIFAVISRYYFKRLGHSSPLATALAFLLVVIGMDVFVVALIVNRSFEMFRSPLGT